MEGSQVHVLFWGAWLLFSASTYFLACDPDTEGGHFPLSKTSQSLSKTNHPPPTPLPSGCLPKNGQKSKDFDQKKQKFLFSANPGRPHPRGGGSGAKSQAISDEGRD